ncbi:MAG TPA: DUF488 domain-containing protein [Thermoplasmata archaeon]|nr:DUF488 domain-containing protein [Thermoplasmata archaeon]
MIRVKRIYDPPSDDDGFRILIDRLWPRGVSKTVARIDEWLKDVAPSEELRRWFHHEESRYAAFREKYRRELRANQAAIEGILARARSGRVTLVFAAHDPAHCNATVLHELLEELSGAGRSR